MFTAAFAIKHIQRLQRGLTLIELMVVLAIIAVILALALKPVRTVLANAKANDEVGELPTIITNMQKVYANRASFAGATQATFVNSNVFPTSRVVSGSTDLINRWGGAIIVSVITMGEGTPNNGISLTYQGVPSLECAAIIPQMDDNIRVVTVNGTTVKEDRQPSDPAAVGTACQSSNANEIVYQFSK